MARSIFYYTDSDVLGGAEEALLMVIERLDRGAWRPTLLMHESHESHESAGGEAIAARARELGAEVRMITPLPLGLAGAAAVPGLVRMLRRDRPDVFHAQLSWQLAAKYALSAAVLARVPAVLGTVQLVLPDEIDRSNALQMRALVRRLGRIIAVSHDTERQLVQRLGWPAAKIEVVHNAVAADRFAAPPPTSKDLRADLTANTDQQVVLTIARLDPQKGHAVLLDAAAQTPDVVFALAGDGPERAALEQRASALGVSDRVLFLGHRTDVPELLGACDLFALPSLYEGSSLAILEAMAAGRAVVSSTVPGTDELISDGRDGVLVPPGDPTALAGALARLLADPPLRAALGDRARERATGDFGADAMTRKVTGIYDELLSESRRPTADRNALLRRVDWRVLLDTPDRPRTLNLARGRLAEAVALVTEPIPGSDGPTADLVVLSAPRPAQLRRAHAALRPGGEVYCEWRLPSLARGRTIRRALTEAGFEEIRWYWPGPRAGRGHVHFWLPLDSPEAQAHLLATRPPPRTRAETALRHLWRAAARAGALAPVSVLARRPGGPSAADSELTGPWLLLTDGSRAVNKIVALPFPAAGDFPARVLKFARVREAESGLEREAGVLRGLERAHPDIDGIPRLHAQTRRAGGLAIVETAIRGEPLMQSLTPATFAQHASAVTDWLVALAGTQHPRPQSEWSERLVARPIEQFERQFGSVAEPDAADRARTRLEDLGALPLVPEHRDCSPWNILLTGTGTPALLDWESAEPHGLPLLDLTYFLANAVFVREGALEDGRTAATYAAMLDPSTPHGRVAAGSTADYCARLGLDPGLVPSLRLLTWIVHSSSDYRHRELDAGGRPSESALRTSVFLGLVHEELGRDG